MEDWHSAFSEPWGSELSLDYYTAYEDNGSIYSRSFARSVSHVEEGAEAECHVKFQETSERSDGGDIIPMLYMLNDCIECMNLFVKEREEQGFSRKYGSGFCSKKRKDLYSSEDVKRELGYIEKLLDTLQIKAISFLEKVDPLLHDTFVAELASVSANDKENIDNFSNDKKSQVLAANQTTTLHSNGLHGEKSKEKTPSDRTMEKQPLPTIVEEGKVAKETRMNGVNGHSKTYVFSDKEPFRETAKSDHERHSPDQIPMSVTYLGEINLRVDLYKKYMELNSKISVANRLLGFLARDGTLDEQVKSMGESLSERRKTIGADVQLTSDSKSRFASLRNFFCVNSIDSILFEKEKWRIEVVQRNGEDPLDHLCGIALPLQYESFKNDTRATYYGIKRKNLLSISLQTADMSERTKKGLFAKAFSLFMLVLSIALYVSDVLSDLVLAGDHYSHGNSHYGALTLVFVFAPYIAETLSKLILKALGWDKEYGKLKWKDVFSFNDFKILKWMAISFRYAVNTWKDYQPFAPCYAELHAYRCRKGKMECKTVAPEADADSTFIHIVYSSMLAWNERFTLQTKLAESLSEAAPQLLLQLFIVIRQFMAGDYVGFKSWFSIVTSVLSLSWSIHLSHYNRHYVEGGRVLENPYTWSGRIMEFIGNCFVYGSRLTAICLVTTMLGAAFVGGFFVYLAIIYVLMITISARKEIYKTLHRYKTTIFWPLHRMFTVPYRIGIWRMDSVDHILFYLEIIFMSISLPFIMSKEVSNDVSWITTGSLLACQAIGMILLLAFKRFLHPYGYVCENR